MDNLENIGEVFFWVPLSVLLLAVLGLLWAPAAALICILVARFRRLDGESYGADGAKLSMLLVLPWVYMLARMVFGRSLPVSLVLPIYALVYFIWLVLYIVAFNIVGLIWSIVDIFVTHSQPLSLVLPFGIFLSVMLPFNIYTWWASIRKLRLRYTTDKEYRLQPALTMPNPDYLAPFMYLIGWSIVVMLITIIAGLAAYTGT